MSSFAKGANSEQTNRSLLVGPAALASSSEFGDNSITLAE